MTDPTPHDPNQPAGESPFIAPGNPLGAPAGESGRGATPPPASPSDGQDRPRRLTRSRSERVFGGVAGGLGRYFDVDPVVFRIGFAAATVVGGVGLFVYLAALLFVPEEGSDGAPADRSTLLTVAGAVILGIAALAALGNGDLSFGPLVPIAILGGLGYGIFRAVRGRDDGRPLTVGRMAGWVALGTGALLAGTALAIGSAWAAAEGSGALVAGVVIAIGVLLVTSAARRGGTQWLVLPALLMAVPLGIVSAAGISFDGGFGDRHYHPASVADLPAGGYRLGAGDIVVDLRDVDLPAARETVLDLQLGMGSAEVLVSEDTCVTTDTRVGGGYVNLRGRESGGVDMDFRVRADAAQAPRLLLRGDIGLGTLEIRDEPSGRFDRSPRFGRGIDGSDTSVQDGPCSSVEIASTG